MTGRKPGEKAPTAGIYQEVKRTGQLTGNTAKMDKGETLPPTDKGTRTWVKK